MGESRQGTCLDFARQLQYGIRKSKQIIDTTKPSARMGRKATGSPEDSRVAEISTDIRSRLFSFDAPNTEKIKNRRWNYEYI